MAADKRDSPSAVLREMNAKGQPKLAVTDPEYTLSIIGLVASFCSQPLVGLILSAIALKRSKAAQRANVYALTGLIISIVLLSLSILAMVVYGLALIALFAARNGQ